MLCEIKASANASAFLFQTTFRHRGGYSATNTITRALFLKSLTVVSIFSLFHHHLPFEKDVGLNLHNLKTFPALQGCFVRSLVEIGPVDLKKEEMC